MSLTDTQSPLNVATLMVAVSEFLMECVDAPDHVRELLGRIAELQVDFVREQQARIGDALVWPGHGFSSSRAFCGLGQSDDNLLTMSGPMYGEVAAASFSACGEPLGGVAFHSCGNWSSRLPVIRRLPGLRMVDAAFGPATDPHPNPPEPFAEVLAGTGIVLNARIVGPPEIKRGVGTQAGESEGGGQRSEVRGQYQSAVVSTSRQYQSAVAVGSGADRAGRSVRSVGWEGRPSRGRAYHVGPFSLIAVPEVHPAVSP